MNLTDQNGNAFHIESLSGHVVLFNFIYTGCSSTCPLQTRVLADVIRALPTDIRPLVRFVSVSIDPANDTSGRLQEFARHMRANEKGWTFVTGDSRQIEQLTQRLHLFDDSLPVLAKRPQIHRSDLWLVDKQGRMLQRYRGNPPDKKRLIRELSQVSRMITATR